MSHVIIGLRSNAMTVSNVIISDIGFIVPSGGVTITYTDDLDIAKLLSSADLVTLSTDNAYPLAAPGNTNTLILTDGTNDIPPTGIADFLSGIEAGRRNNCDAIVPPGQTDDSDIGYAVCSRWVNTVTNEAWICVDATPGSAVWSRIDRVPGNEEALVVNFAFGTGTPLNLGSLKAGDKVINSEIDVLDAFNGAAPTATLGTPGSPGLLLEADDSKLSKVGSYGSDINHSFTAPDTLQLVLSFGASTTGSARALVTIRRA